MGSKAFLLLGLLLAIVLLISSEVAARDLAKTSSDQKNVEAAKEANGVDVAKYSGYGGYPEGRHRVMTPRGDVPLPPTGGDVPTPPSLPLRAGLGVHGPAPRCTRCCSYA